MKTEHKVITSVKQSRILLVSLIIFLAVPKMIYSQALDIEWQKCLDGDAKAIIQISDGGYIIAGTAPTNIKGLHGGADAWVAKLDSFHNIQWQKSYGGTGDDFANSITKTSDGGYIFAGYTTSTDGDVSGLHPAGGFGTSPGDMWVVKIDSLGKIVWQKCLGGNEYDQAYCIKPTFDGGYILAGTTDSYNGDVTGYHTGNYGNLDAWILKISNFGNIEWQKSFGGTRDDYAYTIIQTKDSGYVFVGETNSDNGDISGYHSPNTPPNFASDAMVVKLNSSGKLEWQKCLGGIGEDVARSIIELSDGSYAVLGFTGSTDGDVTGNHGGETDGWIVKLNHFGQIIWQKCVGGSNTDYFQFFFSTVDNGFIIAGTTLSKDGDVIGNHGQYDIWFVKLDSIGKIQWQKCYGGTNIDWAPFLIQTFDGNYAFVAQTYSNDGDVVVYIDQIFGQSTHAWVVKLIPHDTVETMTPTARKGTFEKRLDFGFSCEGNSVVQAPDGGFYIGGRVFNDTSKTSYRPMIARTDSKGNPLWSKSIDFTTAASFSGISLAWNGGIVATGYVNDTNNYGSLIVINFDDTGKVRWSFTNQHYYLAAGMSIIQAKDGGYVILIDDGGEYYYTVLKLNKYGDVQWSTKCGNHWIPNNIIQLKDESYVICATDYQGNQQAPFVLFKLSPSGEMIWHSTVEDVSPSQFSGRKNVLHAYGMTVASDGGFVICGEKPRDIEGLGDPFVAKLDSGGKLLWLKVADVFANARLETIHEIGEGELIASGNFVTTPASGIDWMHPWRTDSLLMMHLSSNGDISSVQILSVPGVSTEARQIIAQTDTTLIITGVSSRNSKQNGVLLMKLDAGMNACDFRSNLFAIKGKDSIVVAHDTSKGVQGLLGSEFSFPKSSNMNFSQTDLCGISSVSDPFLVQGMSISLFPNPATKTATLGFDLPQSSPVEVTIYNILGESIRDMHKSELEGGHNEIPIDLSGFTDGTYFIKIKACGLKETKAVQVIK